METATVLKMIPALVRVALAFGVMLLLFHRRVSLGSAFLAGAVALGLMFHMGPVEILLSTGRSVIYPKTLALSAIVALILVLSAAMEDPGQMRRCRPGSGTRRR